MTFDPFGDLETQGYLRNFAKEKDPDIVRRLEHSSFMTGIDAALERLATVKRLSYADVLETHRILFEAVYPWAGQDRSTTAPNLAISKGPALFAHPDYIQHAADYALAHGQDPKFMREKAGVIMGYLAYAHPFLDGNGRTIMVVHGVMAQRAGFSIDWAATAKADYLAALTKELDDPDSGYLDAYLRLGCISVRQYLPIVWLRRSRRRPALMAPMNRTKSLATPATQFSKRATNSRN